MTTGWCFIGGSWYLFVDGGTMLTDWQKTDAIWYYLGGSDTIATDWRYIDGAWYYFYRLFSTYGGQHSLHLLEHVVPGQPRFWRRMRFKGCDMDA